MLYRLDTGGGGMVALGFSNGANVAATLLQLHPDVPIVGAVLLRPMVVLEQPAAPGSLTDRNILLLNGAHDPIVPTDHPSRLSGLLTSGGARVRSVVHPDAGHGLVPADLSFARDFLPHFSPQGG